MKNEATLLIVSQVSYIHILEIILSWFVSSLSLSSSRAPVVHRLLYQNFIWSHRGQVVFSLLCTLPKAETDALKQQDFLRLLRLENSLHSFFYDCHCRIFVLPLDTDPIRADHIFKLWYVYKLSKYQLEQQYSMNNLHKIILQTIHFARGPSQISTW